MEHFVNLLREWHPLGQFVMLFVLIVAVLFITFTAFMEAAKFINHTLPVLFRGWPPKHVTDKEKEENGEDSSDRSVS